MQHSLLGAPSIRSEPLNPLQSPHPAPLGTADLLRALAIGTVAAVCASKGDPSVLYGQPLAALLLFTGIFVLPRSCAFLSVLAFIGVSFAAGGSSLPFASVRLAIFSLVLTTIRGSSISSYPLLAIVPLWQLTFVFYGIKNPFVLELLPQLVPWTIVTTLLETAAVAFAPFFASCIPLAKLVRIRPASWETQALLFHLLMIPVIGLLAIAALLVRVKTGLTWDGLFERFDIPVRLAGLGILTVVFVCIVLGFVLSLHIARLVEHLLPRDAETDHPSGLLLFDLGLLEEDIIAAQNVASDIMANEERLREVIRVAELREGELLAREHSYQDVIRLLDRSGWGVIAVNDTGTLTLLSRTMRGFLGMPDASFRGKSFSVLHDLRHPWANDLFEAISWARSNPHLLKENGPRSHRSHSHGGTTLTFYIYASEFKNPKMQGGASSTGKPGRAELLTVVLARRDGDLREIQERMLSPFPLEAGGCVATDMLQEYRDELVHLGNAVSLLTTDLHNLRDEKGEFFKSSSIGSRTLELLAGVEQTSRSYRETSKQLLKRLAPVRENIEEINFNTSVHQAITYLLELLGIERALHVGLGESGSRAGDAPPIMVYYPKAEYDGIIRYLLMLLRTSVAAARDLAIDFGEEEISQQAAQLFPGASAGEYARLIVRHPGQSFSPQVLAAHRSARWFAGPPEQAEIALFLCSRQLRRVGGFLSIQSSQSKGTEIAVYIPRDLGKRSAAPSLGESGVFRATGDRSSATSLALFVSDDERLIRIVREQLTELGYQSVVKIPDEFILDLDHSLEFGGSGFGEPDPLRTHEVFSAAMPNVVPAFDLSPFDMIIVDGGASHPPPRALLETVAKEQAGKRLMLLTPGENGPIDLPTTWRSARRDEVSAALTTMAREEPQAALPASQ